MESGSIFRKLARMAGSWIPRNAQEPRDLYRKYESLAGMFGSIRIQPGDQPESFYRDVVLKVSELFQPDIASVLMPDAARRCFLPFFTIPSPATGRTIPVVEEQSSTIRELRAGKEFVCSPCPGNGRNGLGAASCCHFPIIVDGNIEAILFLASPDLSASDIQIVAGFCRQAAFVLGNQRMYRTLAGRLNHVVSLEDALTAFSRADNEKELLRTILEKAAELLNAEQGSLVLIDREDRALLLKAKKGAVDGLVEETRLPAGDGISGRVAQLGEPMLVENLETDPRTNRKNRFNYRTRSFVSVPIRIDDRVIGVINLADKGDGTAFTTEDLKLVQSITNQAAAAIERSLLQNRIEELTKLSGTDQLTGLMNRRFALDRLKDELERSKRIGAELGLLMLDLDGFKPCNDLLGHLVGDRILVQTAETVLAAVRSMDVVTRYGGDEFLIILPGASRPVALRIAERIRAAVDDLARRPEFAAAKQRFSTSIGLAVYPGQGSTIEELLSNADTALYRAKKNGKNRVEITE